MGLRRERFDKRQANQIATRERNKARKGKERVRRAAKVAAKAQAAAAK